MKHFSLSILTLLSALLSATVAGVFSIAGMMVIFAGIPQVGIAAGVATEFAKLMAVSWVYRNWSKKSVIVFGEEGPGLSKETLALG